MNIQDENKIIELNQEIIKLQIDISLKKEQLENLNNKKIFNYEKLNKKDYEIKCLEYLLNNNNNLHLIEKLLSNIIFTESLESNLLNFKNKNMDNIIKYAQLQHKRYLNINDNDIRYELFDLNFFSIFV